MISAPINQGSDKRRGAFKRKEEDRPLFRHPVGVFESTPIQNLKRQLFLSLANSLMREVAILFSKIILCSFFLKK